MKRYTWKSEGFWRTTYYIYSEEILIATIDDWSLKKSTSINGNKFLATEFKYYSYHIDFCDLINPETGKKYCRIERKSEPDYRYGTYTAFLPDKTIYKIDVRWDENPRQSNDQAIQEYGDKLFFSKSGKIEVRSDKDFEILIACLLFVSYDKSLYD